MGEASHDYRPARLLLPEGLRFGLWASFLLPESHFGSTEPEIWMNYKLEALPSQIQPVFAVISYIIEVKQRRQTSM